MKDLSRFLIVVSDTLVKYHEPIMHEGSLLHEFKFNIRKRTDGYWYNSGMDIEGETPLDVAENYFENLENEARWGRQDA